MTSSLANLISARTQLWDTHTSSGDALLGLVTSMITARVTGLCRAEHRNRGTLAFVLGHYLLFVSENGMQE